MPIEGKQMAGDSDDLRVWQRDFSRILVLSCRPGGKIDQAYRDKESSWPVNIVFPM